MNNSLEQELEYFNKIMEFIHQQLQILYKKQIEIRGEVKKEREYMWDGGKRHSIKDFDDIIELGLHDQNVTLIENKYLQNESEINKLEIQKKSPYFGRFDFLDKYTLEHNTIYLGAYSLMDSELIVDWRAPICSAYYDLDLGDGYYEVNSERTEINVTLKRQYKIIDGKFVYMYDTDSLMYDNILGEVLSKKTNNKLRVIVNSIQKEQNKAIRSSSKHNVLIYGLAGSGKTSVGLHRLAYVLYCNRGKIKSEDIVILSNNTIFNSYISNILPELGENPATYMIFYELLISLLPKGMGVESYYDQLKAIENNPLSERVKLIKIKYSYDLIQFFIKYFSSFSFIIPEVKYKEDIIVSPMDIENKLQKMYFSNFRAKIEIIHEIIKVNVEEYFFNYKDKIMEDIVNDSLEYISIDEIEFLYKKAKFEYAHGAIERFGFLNKINQAEQLTEILKLYSKERNYNYDLQMSVEKGFARGKLLYEDSLLYLLVCILMGEVKTFTNVLHVLIDESQDFNLLQMYIIKSLFPKSIVTLLADVYQAANNVTTIQSYEDFKLIFGKDMKEILLPNCYRSSSDINALAFNVLKKYDAGVEGKYSYFNREFKKPKLIITENIIEVTMKILKELNEYNLVGIVVSDEKEATKLKKSIGNTIDIQLLTKPSDELKSKIVIIPLLLSKGLEFDAVLLINSFKNNENRSHAYQRLYLGFTRALHELFIIEEQQISSDFEDCMQYIDKVEIE